MQPMQRLDEGPRRVSTGFGQVQTEQLEHRAWHGATRRISNGAINLINLIRWLSAA